MANKKISELTTISSINDADILPIVDYSILTTRKTTVAQLRDYMVPVAAGFDGYVQFNNDGYFGADAGFRWDNVYKTLQITDGYSTTILGVDGVSTVDINNSGSSAGIYGDLSIQINDAISNDARVGAYTVTTIPTVVTSAYLSSHTTAAAGSFYGIANSGRTELVMHAGQSSTTNLIRSDNSNGLAIYHDNVENLRATATTLYVNNNYSNLDFNIRGDGYRDNLFLVDGGLCRVGINRSAGTHGATLDVDNLINAEKPLLIRDDGYEVFSILDGGGIQIAEQSAPSTPPSGFGCIYEKTNNRLYFKNDLGTEYDLLSTPAAPGGVDNNVQFNDSSAFGGQAGFAYIKSTGRLGLSPTGLASAPDSGTMLHVRGGLAGFGNDPPVIRLEQVWSGAGGEYARYEITGGGGQSYWSAYGPTYGGSWNGTLGKAGSVGIENAGSSKLVLSTTAGGRVFIGGNGGSGAYGVIVDAANNVVMGSAGENAGGTVSATAMLEIRGAGGTPALIVNETGSDSDFRVETDGYTHALFVDANNTIMGANGAIGCFTTNPQSGVDIKTSQGLRRENVIDMTYSVSDSDYLIAYSAIASPRSVYLLSAIGRTGRIIEIKDESGSAIYYPITITPYGSETIDGAATLPINRAYGYAKLYSDGYSWHVLNLSSAGGATSQQESVTTQTIIDTDTALTDTLNSTPTNNASVILILNGIFQRQGAGFDYTISGSTITWLASTGTAVNMTTSDVLIAIYTS